MKLAIFLSLTVLALGTSPLGYAMDTNENTHENTGEQPTKKQKLEESDSPPRGPIDSPIDPLSDEQIAQIELEEKADQYFQAVVNDDIELVKDLLNEGFPVDYIDATTGTTAFFTAAEEDQPDLIALLAEHGANVNFRHTHGDTALHRAARKNNHDLIVDLAMHGADVTLTNNYGELPLHIAARRTSSDTLGTLLALTPQHLLNAENLDGRTPLAQAIRAGSRRNVEVLPQYNVRIEQTLEEQIQQILHAEPLTYHTILGHRAQVETILRSRAIIPAQAEEMTPLHWAAARGHSDIIELLLNAQAQINAQDENEMRPLHLAAQNGHTNLIPLLIQHGADPHAQDSDHYTPLHHATLRGHTPTAQALIEAGAHVNIALVPEQPLHVAVRFNQLQLIALLVLHHADIDARNEPGMTPLHLAIGSNNLNVIRALLHNQANVNVQTNDGQTAADYAQAHHRTEALELINHPEVPAAVYLTLLRDREPLLAQTAEALTETDGLGTNPLSLAIQMGYDDVTCPIVNRAPNLVHQADRQGWTPLHYAAARGNDTVLQFLLARNAAATQVTHNRQTPADVAQAHNHLTTLELLRTHVLQPFVERLFRAGQPIGHLREIPSDLASDDTPSPIAIAGGDRNVMATITAFLVHQTMYHNPNNNNN